MLSQVTRCRFTRDIMNMSVIISACGWDYQYIIYKSSVILFVIKMRFP